MSAFRAVTDTQVFSDDVARAASIPLVVGQMAYQIDNGRWYYASGLMAGDWQSVFTAEQIVAGIPNEQDGVYTLYSENTSFAGLISPSSFTANRSFVLPDASGTFVLAGGLVSFQQVTATGALITGVVSTTTGGVQFYHSGSAFFSIITPSSTTANRTLTLPDASGTFSLVTAVETLTNKTLTAPKIANGGFIADANGNELIKFTTVASAVNEFTVTNAIAGLGVSLSSTGSDADINIFIAPKGAGSVYIDGSLVVNDDATLFGTVYDSNESPGAAGQSLTTNGALTFWDYRPYTLLTDTTTTGNVTTGEDTLQTYSLPAATLSTNGHAISFVYSGSIANTAAAKRIRLKFGATTIFDTGASGITTSTAMDWRIEGEIIRTGAATQKASVSAVFGTVLSGVASVDITTPAETLSGSVVVLLTGEATNTNDILKETAKITYVP